MQQASFSGPVKMCPRSMPLTLCVCAMRLSAVCHTMGRRKRRNVRVRSGHKITQEVQKEAQRVNDEDAKDSDDDIGVTSEGLVDPESRRERERSVEQVDEEEEMNNSGDGEDDSSDLDHEVGNKREKASPQSMHETRLKPRDDIDEDEKTMEFERNVLLVQGDLEVCDVTVMLSDITDKLREVSEGGSVFADGTLLEVNSASLIGLFDNMKERGKRTVSRKDSVFDDSEEGSDYEPSLKIQTKGTSSDEGIDSDLQRNRKSRKGRRRLSDAANSSDEPVVKRRTRKQKVKPVPSDEESDSEYGHQYWTRKSGRTADRSRQESESDEELVVVGRSLRKRSKRTRRSNLSDEETNTDESETSETETDSSETDSSESYSSSDTESSISDDSITDSESSDSSELEEDDDGNLSWHSKPDTRWGLRKRKILLRKKSVITRRRIARMCRDSGEESDADNSQ